jgi:hypothetical protein
MPPAEFLPDEHLLNERTSWAGITGLRRHRAATAMISLYCNDLVRLCTLQDADRLMPNTPDWPADLHRWIGVPRWRYAWHHRLQTWLHMWWNHVADPIEAHIHATMQPDTETDDILCFTHEVRDLHLHMRDFLTVMLHRESRQNYEVPEWALDPASAFWNGHDADPAADHTVILESHATAATFQLHRQH